MTGNLATRPWSASAGKRLIDVVLSLAGLVAAAPLMAAVALLVRVRMGSPILFRQTRVGLHGQLFELSKFRTMVDEVTVEGEVLDEANRITNLGRWLRRTSLDELPELVHVVRGQMSIVGPRPLLPQYLARYSTVQARRHSVRPGLTGLAQVMGRNSLSWDEKLALDVEYVERASPGLDLRIVAATLGAVLRSHGISSRDHPTSPEFMGNVVPNTVDPASA